MSSFQRIDGHIGGQGVEVNSATIADTLGNCIKAVDTAATNYGVGEFVYAKGVASTVVGSAVILNMDDWSTTLTVGSSFGAVGIAMSACVAGEFGWYQTSGKAVGKVAAGFANGLTAIFVTATAGQIDDAGAAGDRIKGIKSASAIGTPAAGLAELEIRYPYSDDVADS